MNAVYTQLRLTGSDGQDVRSFLTRNTLRESTAYKPSLVPRQSLGAQARCQDEIRSD